jgi:DNA modification methylase
MNKIICGECAKVLAGFPDDFVDLTVTSPPYDNLRTYNGYVFEFDKIAQQLYRVTKLGGVVVWVVGDATIDGSETGTSFRQALYFMGLGFNLHDTMIYQTDKPPMNDNRYQACFEYMFVFSKGRPETFNPIKITSVQGGIKRGAIRYRHSNGNLKEQWRGGVYNYTTVKKAIWYYPSGGNMDSTHPAQFPEALARDHIISWSDPGDIVLDPMCGSGTTLKMAVEQGRQYIGIDISPEYCQLSQKRVSGARVPLPGLLEPIEQLRQEHKQLLLV